VPRIVMNIAGIGTAKRIIGKDGQPAPLEDFERVVRINLIGTYNVARLAAARIATLAGAGRRRARRDGQHRLGGRLRRPGRARRPTASKGGVVGMTLPLARDLAQWGVRVCTIAPGLFATPLLAQLPEAVQQSLAASIPFPKRLGAPGRVCALARTSSTNGHLNGEVIRLDGALRMAPR
jgi:NAD(P)-dependent dehydrogenase (short-subunit alcohol dehydrogenase family)